MANSRRSCWGLIGLLALCAGPGWAEEPGWPSREAQFRELPREARRLTGPLFWLHGDESPERLRETLAKVAEGGNGMFTAESRPHKDWLGSGWYRDLAVCLDAAKSLDLQMWIFDEEWWPSGEVGGRVPEEFSSKRLGIRGAARVEGGKPIDLALEGSGEKLIAVLAGQEQGDEQINADSILDLTANVKEGRLEWTPPPGKWRILPVSWEYAPVRRGRRLVDGASQKAVDWYIETVYQPHHDHFGADFGKTIQGYFYDEPETIGDWGTEVIPELSRRGVDWKKAVVAYKVGLSDPALDAAYKYQYRYAFAEAWGRTLFGGITAWCRAHGVRSFGHFLEHNHEYLHPLLCAGDMMQLQKYSDMGGIDAVFKQFVPGQKDDSTYQSPKLGSSISHAYGKADDLAMVEIYGARGQDVSYPEIKWWCDLMHVSGINVHVPHSFNPRAPYDTDCPPYFYNGGYEPRFPLYKVYADYTSRLSLLLSGGRHVAPVAVLYLGQSFHVGKAVTPENLTTALQDSQYDCDWIPYDVFQGTMRVEGSSLTLRDERYRVLVVPPVEVIPHEVLVKAKAFFDAGGVVVGYGYLPSISASPGHAPESIRALCESIWGALPQPSGIVKRNDRGGRALFLSEKPTAAEVARVLTEAGVRPSLEVVEGDTGGWLHVLHRVKDNRDVFLIVNQNLDGGPRRFRLRARAAGVPECWDAMRNEVMSIPFTREGEHATLDLTLEPQESVLLVFNPEVRELPRRIEGDAKAVGDAIAVERDPNAKPPVPGVPVRTVSPWMEWLSSGKWIWAPAELGEGALPPPGTRLFRKVVTLPALPTGARARFWIAADNGFSLFVNGHEATISGGGSGDWFHPAELDVTRLLKAGENVLAVGGVNGGSGPNPAGVIGTLVITHPGGKPITVPLDTTWSVAPRDTEGLAWTRGDYDATGWVPARVVASYGDAPWDAIARPAVTLSPVTADPFSGHVMMPESVDLKAVRAYLELEGVQPEPAARVWVNDHDAGGFIGKPLRLDISTWLKPGRNSVRIEPFAPASARVVFYSR